MLREFKAFIAKEKLFDPDNRILLAVSGGLDSVVMCELFHRAGFSFGIAHCNFSLRGKESDEDEVFVEKLARKYKVAFHCKRFSTKKVARDKKLSIQMAARDLRYEWFEEIRSKENYKFIATAHHLDDQIETFFINLQRSTGIAGLHGILPIQKTLVRPLLFTFRKNIDSYARKHKLTYREDSSNAENKYLRNKIRHEIIPVFRELNNAFPQVLTENIQRIREAEVIFRNSIEGVRKKLIKKDKDGLHIILNELNKLVPVDTYAFELLSPFGFNESVIGDLLQSREEYTGKIFYSQTHRLVMHREEIILTPIPDKKDILLKNSEIIIPEERKEIRKPIHLKFVRKDAVKRSDIDPSENMANLDLRNIKFPLVLRKWKKGDSFYPLGMNKKKKLSDYFIDRKLSIPAKEKIWLLCSGKDILWIVGQRIDHRFRITPKTKEVLQVRWVVEK
jgi:tRNA(Ile)-lysidine synthase